MDLKFSMPLWPWLIAAAWIVMIFVMGGSPRFGRRGTQRWIDAVKGMPRLNKFLNRHHGAFRAGFHYVEFIGLYLALYWAVSRGSWQWHYGWGLGIFVAACVYAYIDETHQARTPGRMFRRIDFMHSLMGVAIGLAVVFLRAVIWG